MAAATFGTSPNLVREQIADQNANAEYKDQIAGAASKQQQRLASSGSNYRSLSQDAASDEYNYISRKTGGKVATGLDLGASFAPEIAKAFSGILPELSHAISGPLGPVIQMIGRVPSAVKSRAEYSQLTAYGPGQTGRGAYAAGMGSLGIKGVTQAMLTANVAKSLLGMGGSAVHSLPMMAGMASPLGMGLMGAQALGGMWSKSKIGKLQIAKKQYTEEERKTSLSSAIEMQLNRLSMTGQIQPADQLQIRLLAWIEAHTSVIPLIYTEMDSWSQEKSKGGTSAENKALEATYGVGYDQGIVNKGLTKAVGALQMFNAKYNPITQISEFLLGGRLPGQTIQDIKSGQGESGADTRYYRSIAQAHGISSNVTRLLQADFSYMIQSAGTFEEKSLLTSMLSLNIQQAMAVELVSLRKGMGIPENINYGGLESGEGIFSQIGDSIAGVFQNIPGVSAAFNVMGSIAKFGFTAQEKIGSGVDWFKRMLFGEKYLALQDTETAQREAGLYKSDQQKAYLFLSSSFPNIQEEMRKIGWSQLEVQENMYHVLQQMYSAISGGQEIGYNASKSEEKKDLQYDPLTGAYLKKTEFDTLIKSRKDNIEFLRESEFTTSLAGKMAVITDFGKGVGQAIEKAINGELEGGLGGFAKSVEEFIDFQHGDAKRQESMITVFNNVSGFLGSMDWLYDTTLREKLLKSDLLLEAKKSKEVRDYFDIDAARQSRVFEQSILGKANQYMHSIKAGMKTAVFAGAASSMPFAMLAAPLLTLGVVTGSKEYNDFVTDKMYDIQRLSLQTHGSEKIYGKMFADVQELINQGRTLVEEKSKDGSSLVPGGGVLSLLSSSGSKIDINNALPVRIVLPNNTDNILNDAIPVKIISTDKDPVFINSKADDYRHKLLGHSVARHAIGGKISLAEEGIRLNPRRGVHNDHQNPRKKGLSNVVGFFKNHASGYMDAAKDSSSIFGNPLVLGGLGLLGGLFAPFIGGLGLASTLGLLGAGIGMGHKLDSNEGASNDLRKKSFNLEERRKFKEKMNQNKETFSLDEKKKYLESISVNKKLKRSFQVEERRKAEEARKSGQKYTIQHWQDQDFDNPDFLKNIFLAEEKHKEEEAKKQGQTYTPEGWDSSKAIKAFKLYESQKMSLSDAKKHAYKKKKWEDRKKTGLDAVHKTIGYKGLVGAGSLGMMAVGGPILSGMFNMIGGLMPGIVGGPLMSATGTALGALLGGPLAPIAGVALTLIPLMQMLKRAKSRKDEESLIQKEQDKANVLLAKSFMGLTPEDKLSRLGIDRYNNNIEEKDLTHEPWYGKFGGMWSTLKSGLLGGAGLMTLGPLAGLLMGGGSALFSRLKKKREDKKYKNFGRQIEIDNLKQKITVDENDHFTEDPRRIRSSRSLTEAELDKLYNIELKRKEELIDRRRKAAEHTADQTSKQNATKMATGGMIHPTSTILSSGNDTRNLVDRSGIKEGIIENIKQIYETSKHLINKGLSKTISGIVGRDITAPDENGLQKSLSEAIKSQLSEMNATSGATFGWQRGMEVGGLPGGVVGSLIGGALGLAISWFNKSGFIDNLAGKLTDWNSSPILKLFKKKQAGPTPMAEGGTIIPLAGEGIKLTDECSRLDRIINILTVEGVSLKLLPGLNFSGLGKVFGKLKPIDWTTGLFSGLFKATSTTFDKISSIFPKSISIQFPKISFDGLGKLFKNISLLPFNFLQDIKFGKHLNDVIEIFKKGMKASIKSFGDALSGSAKMLSEAVKGLGTAIKSASEKFTDGISTIYKDIRNGIQTVYGDMKSFLGKLNPITAIKNWGKGISEWWGGTKDIKGFKQKAIDAMTFKGTREKISKFLFGRNFAKEESESKISREDIMDEKHFWKENIYWLRKIHERLDRMKSRENSLSKIATSPFRAIGSLLKGAKNLIANQQGSTIDVAGSGIQVLPRADRTTSGPALVSEYGSSSSPHNELVRANHDGSIEVFPTAAYATGGSIKPGQSVITSKPTLVQSDGKGGASLTQMAKGGKVEPKGWEAALKDYNNYQPDHGILGQMKDVSDAKKLKDEANFKNKDLTLQEQQLKELRNISGNTEADAEKLAEKKSPVLDFLKTAAMTILGPLMSVVGTIAAGLASLGIPLLLTSLSDGKIGTKALGTGVGRLAGKGLRGVGGALEKGGGKLAAKVTERTGLDAAAVASGKYSDDFIKEAGNVVKYGEDIAVPGMAKVEKGVMGKVLESSKKFFANLSDNFLEKIGMGKIAKIAGKAASSGKVLSWIGKKIPFLGVLIGTGLAAKRLTEGDPIGALGEFASGLTSLIPWVGPFLSIGIDAWLAKRDFDKETDPQKQGATAGNFWEDLEYTNKEEMNKMMLFKAEKDMSPDAFKMLGGDPANLQTLIAQKKVYKPWFSKTWELTPSGQSEFAEMTTSGTQITAATLKDYQDQIDKEENMLALRKKTTLELFDRIKDNPSMFQKLADDGAIEHHFWDGRWAYKSKEIADAMSETTGDVDIKKIKADADLKERLGSLQGRMSPAAFKLLGGDPAAARALIENGVLKYQWFTGKLVPADSDVEDALANAGDDINMEQLTALTKKARAQHLLNSLQSEMDEDAFKMLGNDPNKLQLLIDSGAIEKGGPFGWFGQWRPTSDADLEAYTNMQNTDEACITAKRNKALKELRGEMEDSAFKMLAGNPDNLDRLVKSGAIEKGGLFGWYGKWQASTEGTKEFEKKMLDPEQFKVIHDEHEQTQRLNELRSKLSPDAYKLLGDDPTKFPELLANGKIQYNFAAGMYDVSKAEKTKANAQKASEVATSSAMKAVMPAIPDVVEKADKSKEITPAMHKRQQALFQYARKQGKDEDTANNFSINQVHKENEAGSFKGGEFADPNSAGGSGIYANIADIANKSGASPVETSYLQKAAAIESGGNPNAKAKTSSATGLFQFIDSTAKNLGIIDPETGHAKTDVNAQVGGMLSFTRDNSAVLNKNGIPITDESLYLSHFLGPGGATQYYKTGEVSDAAKQANSSIFSQYTSLDDFAKAKMAKATTLIDSVPKAEYGGISDGPFIAGEAGAESISAVPLTPKKFKNYFKNAGYGTDWLDGAKSGHEESLAPILTEIKNKLTPSKSNPSVNNIHSSKPTYLVSNPQQKVDNKSISTLDPMLDDLINNLFKNTAIGFDKITKSFAFSSSIMA